MIVFRTVLTGIVILVIVLIIGPVVTNQFHYVLPHIEIGPFRYLGIILMAIGIPLLIWSAYSLVFAGKNRAVPYESEKDFTPSGPYKYTRNPFMFGCITTLWGEVILFQCLAMAVYAVIVTWCILFWIRCCEEPSLEERYGEEYLTYKRNTPRWFWKFRK